MYSNEIMPDGEWMFRWRIRLKLNRAKMYKHSVSCLSVSKKIEESFRDLYSVASPDSLGIVDVYVDLSQIKMKKKEEEETEHLEPIRDHLCLKNIIIPYLMDILISGIRGVENFFIREDKGEWVIDTKGSNLIGVLSNDLLDPTRCQCSDLWEIRKLLGVEATRQFIINEFYKVLSVSGASVGRRHIELLADSMTFQGKINSVNRYGIDRNETGPLAKASFEESVNNFLIAAVNNETDEMGVSSSIMSGQMAEFGTGYFDVLVDMKINETKNIPDPIGERDKLKSSFVPKNSFVPKPSMASIRNPNMVSILNKPITPIVKPLSASNPNPVDLTEVNVKFPFIETFPIVKRRLPKEIS
jgi:DNA-directed RNA polymerase II subunit RPB1